MTAIQMLSDNTFFLQSRGNKMTLRQVNESYGKWEMQTENASQRAYGGLGLRHFDNLQQVEKHYKSWRGIASLVSE